MSSTYTQNLGLEKPGTGEQAGTWGITANRSYDFLDTAIDGNTSVNLGATSYQLDTGGAGSQQGQGNPVVGRNKMIIWTGGVTGTVPTVDITPSSAQKLYVMRNETSAAIQFKQGPGGSIFTLQALRDAWVYVDGQTTAGAALPDPQFNSILIANDGTGSSVFSVVDPAPVQPSLAYKSRASLAIDMGASELAISTYSTVWLQARGSNSAANPLMLNPAGGNVGIGLGTGAVVPQSTLDVGGDIRMSGQRSVLFWRGDIDVQRGGIQIVGVGDGHVILTPTDNNGTPLNGAVFRLGGFGNFNNDWVGLAVNGNVGIGVMNPQDNLVIGNPVATAQLRIAYGPYGVFFRNDGSSFYLMVTAANDPFGGWHQTIPWPLQIDLASHTVGILGGPNSAYALSVGGSLNVGGNLNMSGGLNAGGNLNISGGYFINGQPFNPGISNFRYGNRAVNQPYQNTTGKVLFVSVGLHFNDPNAAIVYCDSNSNPGTAVAIAGDSGAAWGGYGTLVFIVMPNWWYRVYVVIPGNTPIYSWSEWY